MFLAGVRTLSPILLGVVPFGLIMGVMVAKAGYSPVSAALFSLIAFGGAAQLASLDLLMDGAPFLVAAGTGVVINMRMVMYSASIAPHFAPHSLPTKVGLAFVLSDQAYALSMAKYRATSLSLQEKTWYYLGAGVGLYVTWQAATLAGALLGAAAPADAGLEFAVPLTFMALLFKVLTDKAMIAAAIVGGGVTTLLNVLPANLGFLVGALLGVAVGYALGPKEVEQA